MKQKKFKKELIEQCKETAKLNLEICDEFENTEPTEEIIKKYIVKIHYKGIFGGTSIINLTDKNDRTKGEFYSYEGGCFRLYYKKNGKEYNLSIPLERIDNIEIGTV